MRNIAIACAALAASARLAAGQESDTSRVLVQRCVVSLHNQADMPPNDVGVIDTIAVHDGDLVRKGQLLVQLDDRKAKAELAVAQAKFAAADAKATDTISERYSVLAEAVAKNEYQWNIDANTSVPGSVPKAKLEELRLKWNETTLSIEKAKKDRIIARHEANVAAAEVKAAEVNVERHQIRSPLNGVVEDIRAHEGELIQPSMPVIHIVDMENLRVQGFVSSAKYARWQLAKGNTAVVEFVTQNGLKRSLPGKVDFVRQTTETGDNFMVRVLVENRKVDGAWLLTPGMRADMTIQLGQAAPQSATR